MHVVHRSDASWQSVSLALKDRLCATVRITLRRAGPHSTAAPPPCPQTYAALGLPAAAPSRTRGLSSPLPPFGTLSPTPTRPPLAIAPSSSPPRAAATRPPSEAPSPPASSASSSRPEDVWSCVEGDSSACQSEPPSLSASRPSPSAPSSFTGPLSPLTIASSPRSSALLTPEPPPARCTDSPRPPGHA
eukprot:3683068-Rhodomonas_salina.1